MKLSRMALAVAMVAFALGDVSAADPDCSNSAGYVPPGNSDLAGKINHVIVLMQENRSWDSYYGTIDIPQCSSTSGEPCVDKLPELGLTNPDPLGGSDISTFHQHKYCTEDTAHGWQASHVEFNRLYPNNSTGLNDGFTTANSTKTSTGDGSDPSGRRAMGHYDAGDLNYYNTLVKTFAFGDRYFSSILGPTYPNREYLLAASSFGHVQNDLPPIPKGFPVSSIFTRLDAAGITWKDYFNNLPQAGLVYDSPNTHFAPFETFFADLATCVLPETCQLPAVSIVDPAFLIAGVTGLESTDEHPRNDIQEGQLFVAAVIDALLASPVWKESAMFLVYDEAGGFYDHVVPPPACAPGDFLPGTCPDDPAATSSNGCTSFSSTSFDPNHPLDPRPSKQSLGGVTVGFDRYGFRTPNAVISPWVKPGYVSHQTYDHTSILKFIETRFGLGALTKRDANAADMLDFFDFSQPATAPLMNGLAVLQSLPTPAFDPLRALQCVSEGVGVSDEVPLP